MLQLGSHSVCIVNNTDLFNFLIHGVIIDNAGGFGGHYDSGKLGELRITSMIVCRDVTKSVKY